MYVPAHFAENDLQLLHDFIDQNSFGVIVSQVEGLPFATHLPFLLEREDGRYGTLTGHMARANPQCDSAGEQTVLVIFSGPHTYISPSWYEAENVVPTWNYVAVHVTGKLQIIRDSSKLYEIVQTLTGKYEKSRLKPWSFDGMTTFAERLLTQITGFRLEIERIEGKWKLSQNQPIERREKVIAALRERDDSNSNAIADI